MIIRRSERFAARARQLGVCAGAVHGAVHRAVLLSAVLLSPLLLIAGCAAGDSAADLSEGASWGGQTGSLLPACLPNDAHPFSVPEGDTAFAERVGEGLGAVTLTDAAGNDVPTSVERSGDTTIIRSSDALAVGTYTLTAECSEGSPTTRTVSVTEAAPLPTALGSVEVTSGEPLPRCSAQTLLTLRWTPNDPFWAYLSLVELSVQVDGQTPFVIAASGSLPSAKNVDGTLFVFADLCSLPMGRLSECLPAQGNYVVTAKIAGETESWSSDPLDVQIQCQPDPVPHNASCSVAPRPDSERGGLGWLMLAMFLFHRRSARGCRSR